MDISAYYRTNMSLAEYEAIYARLSEQELQREGVDDEEYEELGDEE